MRSTFCRCLRGVSPSRLFHVETQGSIEKMTDLSAPIMLILKPCSAELYRRNAKPSYIKAKGDGNRCAGSSSVYYARGEEGGVDG